MLLDAGDELRVSLSGDLADYEILDFLDRLRSLNKGIEESKTISSILDFDNGSKINVHYDSIRHCLRDLEVFVSDNKIQKKPPLDFDSIDELNVDDLLGLSFKQYNYTAPIKYWMILAYLKEQDELERRQRDVDVNDWCPPANWATGTDDEKEAFTNYSPSEKNISK